VIVSCEVLHAGSSGRARGGDTLVPGALVLDALMPDPLMPGALVMDEQAATATMAAAMAITDGRFRMAFASRWARGGQPQLAAP
jgi:hypothetical protein